MAAENESKGSKAAGDPVSEAYGRFVTARLGRTAKDRDTEGRLHWESERQLWEAARDVLRAYHRPGNASPFPQELAHWLADAADELLTGRLPESIGLLQRAGTAGYGPRLRSDMEAAVLYVRAAKAGLVEDTSPVRTVAAAYDISEETYRDWRRKHGAARVTDPQVFLPELTDHERAEATITLMRKSAESYRRFRKHRKG